MSLDLLVPKVLALGKPEFLFGVCAHLPSQSHPIREAVHLPKVTEAPLGPLRTVAVAEASFPWAHRELSKP